MRVEIERKTLESGFSMPVFGLGTWRMGGVLERDLNNDDKADIEGIKRAIESGITHIDTAEIYADGYAEILIRQAIKDYKREDLFLVSKAQIKHLKYDDLINSAKKSLHRLGTDYLDLYLMHQHNAQIPLEESMKALDYLKKEGLIRNIGVSNFTKESMAEAQSYSKNKIVVNQVHYNLKYREPERTGLLEYCQNNDVFLMAWRPFQKGLLLLEKNDLMDEMCQKYNKTPAQIGVNWLISQKNVITLAKMRSEEHIKENLGALDFEMEKEDIEKLDKNYPDQQDVSDVVRLG